MTRVTQLIHDAGKYLLISVYPLPTQPTHNFTHTNGGNLETLPGWPKKMQHNRPARSAGQKTHKNKLYCTSLKHPTGYNIGIYEDLYARRRYLNLEKIEILVPGYKGIWDFVFGKSRYLYGLYLFCYGVLKKKASQKHAWGLLPEASIFEISGVAHIPFMPEAGICTYLPLATTFSIILWWPLEIPASG